MVFSVVTVSVLCPGGTLRTPRSHFPPAFWLSGNPRVAPSLPGMQVLVPGLLWLFLSWDAASSLPSPRCQLEPCPQHQPSLGIAFPLAEPQPNKIIFLSPSPTCCRAAWPWGGRWGCGYLSRARIWAFFPLSLKTSTPPGLQTLPHSIEVWGFLLTSYVPVADKIWPVIVEIPACSAFFIFFFPSRIHMLQLSGERKAALTFHV